MKVQDEVKVRVTMDGPSRYYDGVSSVRQEGAFVVLRNRTDWLVAMLRTDQVISLEVVAAEES